MKIHIKILLEELYSVLKMKQGRFRTNAGPLCSKLQLPFVFVGFYSQQHAVLSVCSLPFTVQNISALGMDQGCAAKGTGVFDPF